MKTLLALSLLSLLGVVMGGGCYANTLKFEYTKDSQDYIDFKKHYYDKHGWDKEDCNCVGEWVYVEIPFWKDTFKFLKEKDVYTYVFGPNKKGSIWVCDQPEVWLKDDAFQQAQKERDARHEATNNLS